MKKLLIACTYYYPNISGLTFYVKSLSEEMVKKKFAVDIICGQHNPDLLKTEVINGVNVNRIAGFRLFKGFVMPSYLLSAIPLVKNTDIVNCHLPSIESLILAFLAKLFKKKIVVTYHCNYRNILFEVIHNIILILADTVVVNSLDYIGGYKLFLNFREKVVEIFPPINLKNRKKIIEMVGNKKVGFLGRISKEKGIETLLEAIDHLPKEIMIFIAGPEDISGEGVYKKKILTLMNNYCKRVVRLGVLDESEKVYFLSHCDCMILPSNDPLESFGMVQIEAMVLGTPCVTRNLPGIRVPIQMTGMGKLFDGSSVDLANKIIEVLNSKYSDNKKFLAQKLFDLKRFANNYEKIFG